MDKSAVQRSVQLAVSESLFQKTGRIFVPVASSARHVHLCRADVERLFGVGYRLQRLKDLSQPGQFACEECLDIIGPKGELDLTEGVIIAKRHLHVTEEDAAEMGIKNGEIIKVACGGEGRKLIFDDVVVRVNKDGATTMHIDTDESQAAGNPTVGEIYR